MIGFFTLQRELFTSCNVSNNASLVSARTWGGGGAGQPNVDRPGKGKRVPKNSQICATSFMDDPLVIKLRNSDFKVH